MTARLYPEFKPRGIRKNWDHCSMVVGCAELLLHRLGVPEAWGRPCEVVAWFDQAGAARVIVADYPGNRRATFRRSGRETKLTLGQGGVYA